MKPNNKMLCSSQNIQAYSNQFYHPYIITSNFDTTTPNAYSPVSNTTPATLLATPNNNGYMQYMASTSANSPSSGSNDYPSTPMPQCAISQYCSSPMTIQYVTHPQHSPMPYFMDNNTPPSSNNNSQTNNVSYLQDIHNISSISNNNNNNSDYYNYNKENQRPSRGYRNNNNKRYSKLNNSNFMNNNKNVNYKRMNNSYMQNEVQMQENNNQIAYSQIYQDSYFCDSPRQSTQSPALDQGVNDSYVTSHFSKMPSVESTNYEASPLPLTPLGLSMQSNEYHKRDNINNTGDYQDIIQQQQHQQNDSSHDEKLACKICRGRKKCFCYFLKVGYFKFPSYHDYAIHQQQQCLELLKRSRRM